VGKPDDKYFDSIPEYWSIACRDVNLRLLYYPQSTKINLNQSSEIHISLTAPPHRIHGNDTVCIQWKQTQCDDCVAWTPKQLSFTSENFQEKQILTVTRVKDGPDTTLIPIFYGGGFDFVPPEIDRIHIQ
jgi:calcineurin-like phosphoesterase family protein